MSDGTILTIKRPITVRAVVTGIVRTTCVCATTLTTGASTLGLATCKILESRGRP